MRILYIGTYAGGMDEGLAQLSRRFAAYFGEQYDVRELNTFEVLKPAGLREIRDFAPHIIHYLTGPRLRSFVSLQLARASTRPGVRTIISATRPYLKPRDRFWIRRCRPDLVLTQAEKWRHLLESCGVQTEFVPNPVAVNRFCRLKTPRNTLRQRYGLPSDQRLLLHVGHIRYNRNLEVLAEAAARLIEHDIATVVVGSTNFETDPLILEQLQSAGCIVIDRFLENIAEVYNACDMYAFPVTGLAPGAYPGAYNEVGVIDMPLSILEALCCGIPVVTTRIDALYPLLDGIADAPLRFYDGSAEDLVRAVLNPIPPGLTALETLRTRVSEAAVFGQVEACYRRLTANRPLHHVQEERN